MRADKMAFEIQYSDGTGPQFSIELDGNDVWVVRGEARVLFPCERLDWMIDALCRIREEFQKGTAP